MKESNPLIDLWSQILTTISAWLGSKNRSKFSRFWVFRDFEYSGFWVFRDFVFFEILSISRFWAFRILSVQDFEHSGFCFFGILLQCRFYHLFGSIKYINCKKYIKNTFEKNQVGSSFHHFHQQHSCHLPKSNLSQDESLFNSEHFIKRAHPHQTTGLKVTDFWAKKVLFSHRARYWIFGKFLRKKTRQGGGHHMWMSTKKRVCKVTTNLVGIELHHFNNYLK